MVRPSANSVTHTLADERFVVHDPASRCYRPGPESFVVGLAAEPSYSLQRLATVDGQPRLFEHIAQLAQGPWNLNGQLGLVVGATYPEEIARVRALAPTLPLLIPGVGAQGGGRPGRGEAGLVGLLGGQAGGPVGARLDDQVKVVVVRDEGEG